MCSAAPAACGRRCGSAEPGGSARRGGQGGRQRGGGRLLQLGAAQRVQGGALALGHPWAATGAVLLTRIFTQLVREGRGGRGLAAIAIAGGMGAAIAVEAC